MSNTGVARDIDHIGVTPSGSGRSTRELRAGKGDIRRQLFGEASLGVAGRNSLADRFPRA